MSLDFFSWDVIITVLSGKSTSPVAGLEYPRTELAVLSLFLSASLGMLQGLVFGSLLYFMFSSWLAHLIL